eukprot:1156847-Pelagomonas_calceolata.AAC.8
MTGPAAYTGGQLLAQGFHEHSPSLFIQLSSSTLCAPAEGHSDAASGLAWYVDNRQCQQKAPQQQAEEGYLAPHQSKQLGPQLILLLLLRFCFMQGRQHVAVADTASFKAGSMPDCLFWWSRQHSAVLSMPHSKQAACLTADPASCEPACLTLHAAIHAGPWAFTLQKASHYKHVIQILMSKKRHMQPCMLGPGP